MKAVHMKISSRLLITFSLLTMATELSARAEEPDDQKVRRSIVKITASLRTADVFRPWTKNAPQEVTGSGVVITGNRILTNSHVVNAASQIFVQPDKSSEKLIRRYGDRPAFADERLVILAHPMFTHKISTGYKSPYADAVDKVNGVHIRNLKHLVETLRDATGEFVEFAFLGRYNELLVFKRKEVLDATEEILSDNGIRQQYSANVAPIWNQGNAKKP
jgi:hypothetical protein